MPLSWLTPYVIVLHRTRTFIAKIPEDVNKHLQKILQKITMKQRNTNFAAKYERSRGDCLKTRGLPEMRQYDAGAGTAPLPSTLT